MSSTIFLFFIFCKNNTSIISILQYALRILYVAIGVGLSAFIGML